MTLKKKSITAIRLCPHCHAQIDVRKAVEQGMCDDCYTDLGYDTGDVRT